MTSPLVSAPYLIARLRGDVDSDGEPVTVLDARYQTGAPSGRPAYEAGHVPGAAYVDVDSDLAAPPARPGEKGGRHPLPATADFQAAMRRAGVRNDRPV